MRVDLKRALSKWPATWPAVRGIVRETFTAPKIVVYTAVTGNYDDLLPPAMKVPGWDYLCFTDEPLAPKFGWSIRALPKNDLDQIRLSRLPKILPHRLLTDYDVSIWIDGHIGIRGDLGEFCRMALMHADIAFFRHGELRPSVAAEIQACWQAGKAPLEVMNLQYQHYLAEGFPDNAGIIPEAAVIVRRHHRAHICAVMEQWWGEFQRHCARDQVSLPYVIWKNSLVVTLLDWDVRSAPWFEYRGHSQRNSATAAFKTGH